MKRSEQTARACNEIGRDLLGAAEVMYDFDKVKCLLNKGRGYIFVWLLKNCGIAF